MDGKNLLSREFETNRKHLRAVAYRMLGSLSEAEDWITALTPGSNITLLPRIFSRATPIPPKSLRKLTR